MNIKNSKTTQDHLEYGTSNHNIVSKSFTDVDAFQEFFAYRGVEIIQLTPGSLEGSFFSIQVGDIYFIYLQTNQGTQAFGDKLKEYRSFSIVWFDNKGEFHSYHHLINPKRTIFGFNGMETTLVVSQGGVMIDIYIPLKTFHTYADKLQRHDLDDSFLSKNHVNLLPTGMNEIKDYLKQLFWLALHEPNWLQKPHIEKLITDDFLPLLISHIPIKLNSKSFLKPSRREQLIALAEQKMLAHLETPLTLKQLAENLGCSSRALSFGFKDLFGVSPMRYLKIRRLNAVRKHLKASEPENCTISILASEFGFYSPCHFTQDYKTMFGELPSETLRKTAKS
ncbi:MULTISPECIES: AraC family transcriptional regulator [Okeania]|uniref:AraC family transcriptional regulator n=1 Tax=Okeania hirsuta TaxID=1458930 RepID=A0A3N6P6D3_9CYAN|nr:MULTISPECIES: AraC family transcriptional regulator [Okeania]NET80066.1 helix-turn-helix transcriptional regulator [Okeania sp. SIO1F9]RQH12205.1 AraC family transcriptional regulator [Okeania hirsuta]RQH30669.1 AraC family transcriptional regulator [Okeania hirsuta]